MGVEGKQRAVNAPFLLSLYRLPLFALPLLYFSSMSSIELPLGGGGAEVAPAGSGVSFSVSSKSASLRRRLPWFEAYERASSLLSVPLRIIFSSTVSKVC